MTLGSAGTCPCAQRKFKNQPQSRIKCPKHTILQPDQSFRLHYIDQWVGHKALIHHCIFCMKLHRTRACKNVPSRNFAKRTYKKTFLFGAPSNTRVRSEENWRLSHNFRQKCETWLQIVLFSNFEERRKSLGFLQGVPIHYFEILIQFHYENSLLKPLLWNFHPISLWEFVIETPEVNTPPWA